MKKFQVTGWDRTSKNRIAEHGNVWEEETNCVKQTGLILLRSPSGWLKWWKETHVKEIQ